MTRQEQLKFCSVCAHRQMDMKQGIICELTGAKADFDGQCPQYVIDPEQAAKEQEKEQQAKKEALTAPENPKMKGATLFILVGVVSLINLILELAGIRLIFGLGITSALHELWGTGGLIISSVVCILFIVLGWLANRKEAEWAYRLAFFGYLADTVLMVIVMIHTYGFIKDNIFHLVILLCTYPLHPFYSKAIREKAKTELWHPVRIVLTALMTVLFVSTLILSFNFHHDARKARDGKALNELKSQVTFNEAMFQQMDGKNGMYMHIEVAGDSVVRMEYRMAQNPENIEAIRQQKQAMNIYIKEYLLLSAYGYYDPFLQQCIKADCPLSMHWFDADGAELYQTDFSIKELAAMYKGKHEKTFDSVWKKFISAYNDCAPVDFLSAEDGFQITRVERTDATAIIHVNIPKKLSAQEKREDHLQLLATAYNAYSQDAFLQLVKMNHMPLRIRFSSDKEPSWSQEVEVKK